MLNNGNVIYLKASPEEIYNRIKNLSLIHI